MRKRATLQQCYTAPFQTAIERLSADAINLSDSNSIFPFNSQLNKVFHFIESNYQQPINLGDIAQEVGYSPAYLTNLVRRQTGKTVQGWIIERRMAAARYLLLFTSETVEDIAIKVGYQNTVHFFRQFRQHHGTTPQVWRKTQLDQDKADQHNC
nr:AraC family transcriptional regulator [Komarekiella delphini-convector]